MSSAQESAKQGTLLDVEDEASRQERLGRLFAAQSSAPDPTTMTIPKNEPPSLGNGKTYAVPPPTDLLSRLEAFLPAMKEANEALQKKVATEGPASVDIENGGPDAIDSDDGHNSEDDASGEDDFDVEVEPAAAIVPPPQARKPYIEMNLGLGVFEERPRPDHASGGFSGPAASDSEKDSSDTESTTSSGSSDTGADAGLTDPDLPPAKKGRFV